MSKKMSESIEAFFSMEAMTLGAMGLVVVTVLACSKKTDGAADTPATVNLVTDISQFINFQSSQFVPQNNEAQYQQYLEERFGESCQVRRRQGKIVQMFDKPFFETDVMIGHPIFVSVQSQNQVESRKLEQSVQIREENVSLSRSVRTTQSLVIPQAGGEILRAPISDYEECRWVQSLHNDGPKVECRILPRPVDAHRPLMTNQGWEYLSNSRTRKIPQCQIFSPTQVLKQIEKGTYKLANGQQIQAYRTVETVIGPVFCDQQFMGEGSDIRQTIHSNEIQAVPGIQSYLRDGFYSCGGAFLAESRIIKIQDKMIDSLRVEVKNPPLRSAR